MGDGGLGQPLNEPFHDSREALTKEAAYGLTITSSRLYPRQSLYDAVADEQLPIAEGRCLSRMISATAGSLRGRYSPRHVLAPTRDEGSGLRSGPAPVPGH
jgi:hypothetical protein